MKLFLLSLQILTAVGSGAGGSLSQSEQVTSKRPRVDHLPRAVDLDLVKSEPDASESTPMLPDMDSDGEVECVGTSVGLSWTCSCGHQNEARVTAKQRAVAPPVCALCVREREQPSIERSPSPERLLPNTDLDTVIWERWLTEQERQELKQDTRWKPVHYTLQFKLEHAFLAGKDGIEYRIDTSTGAVVDSTSREKLDELLFDSDDEDNSELPATPGRPKFSVRFGVYQAAGQMRQSDLPNNSWLTSLQTNKTDPSRTRYLRRRIKLANIALPGGHEPGCELEATSLAGWTLSNKGELEATSLARWREVHWDQGARAIRADVTKGKGTSSQGKGRAGGAGAGASSPGSGAAESSEIRVDEWAAVEALFMSRGMARQSAEVVRIERIQHPGMADAFDGYAYQPAVLNQHWLWHGTKKENLDGIAQSGLSTRLTGTNHTFGKGGYFAAQPSYSHKFHYANPYTDHNILGVPADQKVQTIVLARVKVGRSKPGTADVTSLPPFGEFDSTSDRDQSIFVVYNDLTHSYPCYFVTYTVPDAMRQPGAVIAAHPPESSGFAQASQQSARILHLILKEIGSRLSAHPASKGNPSSGAARAETNKALLQIVDNFQALQLPVQWNAHPRVREIVRRFAATLRQSGDPITKLTRMFEQSNARVAAAAPAGRAAAVPLSSGGAYIFGVATGITATGVTATGVTAAGQPHSSADTRIQGRPKTKSKKNKPWKLFHDIDAAVAYIRAGSLGTEKVSESYQALVARKNILKACEGKIQSSNGWEWRSGSDMVIPANSVVTDIVQGRRNSSSPWENFTNIPAAHARQLPHMTPGRPGRNWIKEVCNNSSESSSDFIARPLIILIDLHRQAGGWEWRWALGNPSYTTRPDPLTGRYTGHIGNVKTSTSGAPASVSAPAAPSATPSAIPSGKQLRRQFARRLDESGSGALDEFGAGARSAAALLGSASSSTTPSAAPVSAPAPPSATPAATPSGPSATTLGAMTIRDHQRASGPPSAATLAMAQRAMQARLAAFRAGGGASSATAQLEARLAALQSTIKEAGETSHKRPLDSSPKKSDEGDGKPSKRPKGNNDPK